MRFPKHIYFNPFFRICRTKSEGHHIFVVGPPRSGTTLLANIISNHSNVAGCQSETGLFRWRSVFLLFEGYAGMHSGQIHSLRKECKDVVQLTDKIADMCKKGKSQRFLEKTPQHVLNIGFILEHFPRCKVVNIIRDPRDGYVSSKSNRYTSQKTPSEFASYWARCIKARTRFMGHSSILDTRYEKLVANPDVEVQKIMSWLGETFEPSQIEIASMAKDKWAGKPGFRLLGKAISTSSVGRWHEELSAEETLAIERIARVQMRELGYDVTAN